MKRAYGAVIGLMAVVTSGAAFAQGVYGGSSAGDQSRSSPDMVSADISDSYKSTQLKGMSVENREQEKLGTISDLIIDKDGKVSNIVLREGGLAGVGGNHYLVPWDRVQLTPGEKVAVIDVTRDQLSSEFAAVEETRDAEKEKKVKKSEKSDKPDETGKPSATPGGR